MAKPKEYSTDATVRNALRKVNSKITIHELYGLFYGCMAATNLVLPSRYMPLIYDQEAGVFSSIQEAERTLGEFMSLWNTIARWDPEGDDYFYPEIDYPLNAGGLHQRADDMVSFIQYFMKGLDLGDTSEEDFNDEALDAMEKLAEASLILEDLAEGLEKIKPDSGEGEPAETAALLDRMDHVIIDCIAIVTAELKSVRMRIARSRGEAPFPGPARSFKTGRNDPCPCGSGKKYKKCCAGSA